MKPKKPLYSIPELEWRKDGDRLIASSPLGQYIIRGFMSGLLLICAADSQHDERFVFGPNWVKEKGNEYEIKAQAQAHYNERMSKGLKLEVG